MDVLVLHRIQIIKELNTSVDTVNIQLFLLCIIIIIYI